MSDLVELMAMWESKTKGGNLYVSGYLGSASIVGFRNENKRSDKEPDWKFYISKGKRQREYDEKKDRGSTDTRAPAGSDSHDDRGADVPF